MVKFHIVDVSDTKIDTWISSGVNVLLIGEKGTGKTGRILAGMKRNNKKFAYLPGATVDPWVDVIGVPKAKKKKSGEEFLDFIRPDRMSNDVEFIIVDEYNRAHKSVRNALMELQQFKTMNGREFPNLKAIWGAINPISDDEDFNDSARYDVERLDPAQMDRFHVIVEVPNKPDKKFFKAKYGDFKATILINWWNNQPEDARHEILSPRRLDYIAEFFEKGVDIKDMLPVSCNTQELINSLSRDEDEVMFENLQASLNRKNFAKFVKDEKRYLKFEKRLKEKPVFWRYFDTIKPEHVDKFIKENNRFATKAIELAVEGSEFFKTRLKEISDAGGEQAKYLWRLYEHDLNKSQLNNDIDEVPDHYNFKILNPEKVGNQFNSLIEYVKSNDRNMNYQNIENYNEIDIDYFKHESSYFFNTGITVLKNSYQNNSNDYAVANFFLRFYKTVAESTLRKVKGFDILAASVIYTLMDRLDDEDLNKFADQFDSCGEKCDWHAPLIEGLRERKLKIV